MSQQCTQQGGGRKKETFYLTTHSTCFIYGYIAREETHYCHYMSYSFRLGAGRSSEVERSLMVRWVVGSILHGVDPFS